MLEHDLKEPEDHIALEMAFMAHLTREAYNFRKKDHDSPFWQILRKQKDFFEKHLIAWIPDFCRDLENAAESDFYKGIYAIVRNGKFVRVEGMKESPLNPITRVTSDLTRKVARLYGTTKPACIDHGNGFEHAPSCNNAIRSVAILIAITGKFCFYLT